MRNKTGVSVYKRGSVGNHDNAVWSGDGNYTTTDGIWAWRGALKSAFKAECLDKEGRHINSFVEDLKSLLHENWHRLLMTPPMVFIFTLTILPLVFMICMAFTNYSKLGNHLMLFDWVGLDNFKALFDMNSILGSTFWSVLIAGRLCGRSLPHSAITFSV